MFQELSSYLQDPLFKKFILSGIAIGLMLLFSGLLWRFINSLRIEDEKKQHFRKWVNNAGLSVCVVILVHVWVYDYLIKLFHPTIAENLITSFFSLVVTLITIYFLRRLIHLQKFEIEKRNRYNRWAASFFIVLYGIILVRIWAYSDVNQILQNTIIKKMAISVFALIVIYVVVFIVRRYINSLNIAIEKRHQYRKRASYGAALVYFLVLISIWAGSTKQWATVLSIMGAGVALALHEVLLNIAGWMYIIVRRSYREGDRIELGSVKGDVIDIQLFQTSLLEIGNWVDGDQSTGRVVQLPHGQIFRNPLFNYTKGFEFLWHETSIIITFESDWQKAKEILQKCGEEESHEIHDRVERRIDRMAKEYLIYYRTFTPIVYTKIEDAGVKLTLRYLTDAKKRRTGEDSINRKILVGIDAAPDIEFAYPTYRIYRRGEGEDGDNIQNSK